ncbi:MAG TPA: hypothetical protein VL120_06595 [Solirubrobacteraceae bacterium]|jgi:hypothetical protein|nr:hypothetical protein [Solirubrobacteraceae bacterium]
MKLKRIRLKRKKGTAGAAKAGGRGKKLGKRVLKAGGVLLVALVVVIAAYELQGSDDTEQIAGPPPVRVRVLAPGTFQAAHAYAPYYVVPDKRLASPAGLSEAATNRFVTRPEAALAKGGQAGSPQIVRLELRSTTNDPVTVVGVKFDVVSDARPLKGWFTAQPACSFARVRVVRGSLDGRRTVRYVDAKGASSRKLALALDRTRPAVLELQAATSRHRVAWTARLAVSRDGAAAQTVKVDDNGAPFRVTSARSARGYAPTFGATGIDGFARDRSWDRGRITGC